MSGRSSADAGTASEPKHRKLLSARSISTSQLARLQQQNEHTVSSSSSSPSPSPSTTGLSIGSRIAASSPIKLRLLGRSSTSDVSKNKSRRDDKLQAGLVQNPSAVPVPKSRTEDTAHGNLSGQTSALSAAEQRATDSLVQHALYPPSLSTSSPLSSPNASGLYRSSNTYSTPLRQPPRSHSSRTLKAATSGQVADSDSGLSRQPPPTTPASAHRSDRLPVSPFFGANQSHDRLDMSAPSTPAPPEAGHSRSMAPESDKAGSSYSTPIPTSFTTSALADALQTSVGQSLPRSQENSCEALRSRTTSYTGETGVDEPIEQLASSIVASPLQSSRDAASSTEPAKPRKSPTRKYKNSSAPLPSKECAAEASEISSSNASSSGARRHKDSSTSRLQKSSTSALVASTTAPTAQHATKDFKEPVMPSADVEASIAAGTSVPWAIGTPYWYSAPIWGKPPSHPLRAHSAAMVEMPSPLTALNQFPCLGLPFTGHRPILQMPSMASLWVFGGCDARACFRDTWMLDLESYHWRKPKLSSWQGKPEHFPPPLRAHTGTFIPPFTSPPPLRSDDERSLSLSTDGHILLFGGGDGPSYLNDIYILSLRTQTWCKPALLGGVTGEIPHARRAHASAYYETKKWLIVFGGGNGSRALNDTWVLDCKQWNSKGLNWRKVDTKGKKPAVRGYREFQHRRQLVKAHLASRHDELDR